MSSDAAVGRGLVKAVSSGDTLIVRAIGGGAAPTGPCLPRAAPAAGAPFKAFVPAAEFSLTLAHLQAPRLARANSEVGDDAGAWPAREALREMLIGQVVKFKIVYKRSSEKGERSYAAVWLDGASESVNAVVARAGWAKVIPSRDDKRCDDYETLVELTKAAEAAKVGIFSPEAAPRKLVWALPAESAPAVAAALGSCQAVVEAVINGGLLRVTVVNAEPILCLQFSLAGVAAPRVPAGGAPASPPPATPLAAKVRLVPRASPAPPRRPS